MVMPGMGGAELAETLARSRPTLPTLYASGYSNAALPRVIGAGGAAAQAPYIPKPFTAEQLLTKVREVLDSRR
jgi:CheY-like chemotaxis protein